MIRGLLALFCAVLAMGTSIAASGISARNHATALRLHELQRECELRAAAIEAKTQALIQASMTPGEAMYAAQQATGGEAGAEAHHDDGVVDAEFEEVDDSKKSA